MKYWLLILVCLCTSITQAQDNPSQKYYKNAFIEICEILAADSIGKGQFKEAVFAAENAFFEGELERDKETLYTIIDYYTSICQSIAMSDNINYSEKDSITGKMQCAVFTFMTDSVPISVNGNTIRHIPFSYNYEDFAGQKDWSNMFVSTLMSTLKGNCHSMPYLYKIIMDDLGYDSYLSLAPNHIYIKANNKKVGWYNIELTCGEFPTDAWLMASGYIHIDAIRNGIYLRALSEREAIAMTLIDLAQSYQAKYGVEDGNFILLCCNTALMYFPDYINALLLKGDTLTALYKETEDSDVLEQMNQLYMHIHESGYRKMPEDMYKKWQESLKETDIDSRMKSVINKK